MANMSYCRFENTLRDLKDCAFELDYIVNCTDEEAQERKLSADEHQALCCMFDVCRGILEAEETYKSRIQEGA